MEAGCEVYYSLNHLQTAGSRHKKAKVADVLG
jgi:hypothetical protein